MTMNKAAVLLAALVSASFAAPVTDRANGLNIHKRGGPGYSDIVNPPDGQCALLVYSSTDLPIGGVPTSVEGGGIGPSAVGSPGVFVINMYGDTVGSAALEPQGAGYGFAATFPLDGTLINDAGDIYVTASYIDPAAHSWNIHYQYKGVDQNTDNFVYYIENPQGLGLQQIQADNFPC